MNTRRPKIALLANSTWNIYNFRLGLIRALRREGYEVLIIAPVDQYIKYLTRRQELRHISLRHLEAQRRSPLSDLLLYRELYRILRRERPDLLLSYTIKPNIYGNLAAARLGIPVISTITGLGYTFMADGWQQRLVERLYKLSLKHARRVLFHNRDDEAFFRQRGLLPKTQMAVVPGSGVNTHYFQPLTTDAQRRNTIFLFVGRLLYDKGIREYVEAARQLRELYGTELQCWVLGEVDNGNPAAVSKSELLGWIEAGYIRYKGTAHDVRRYIHQASAMVLPSYREGVPRSLLEGLAMAKPIITTDAPGCRDTVLSGKNGELVPVRDSDALCAAMQRLLHSSRERRLAMGAESRALALRNFAEEKIVGQYLAMIQEYTQHDRARQSSKEVF